MGEEEVKIPIKVEVDTNDLNELKSEVDKVFNSIREYEKKRSTKKDPWNVKNVSEYQSEINNLVAKIARLQQEFDVVSKSTPFSELKSIQSAIGEYIKSNKQDTKELASAVGSYKRQLQLAEKAEQRIEELKKEQTKLQENYNKSVKSIDTSKKGSKSELKDLQKQYQLDQKNLSDQINVEKTKSNLARGAAKTAEDEANSARTRIKIGNEQITNLRVQASEIGKLTKQEGYVEAFERVREKTLQRINNELREASDLIKDYTYNAQRATQKDIKETGYKTPREKAVSKVQEQQARADAKAAREAVRVDRERIAAYNQEYRTRAAIHKEEEKARKEEIDTAVKGYRKEISAIKQSTSQYYYKLRAIKMLSFAVNNVTRVVDKFGKTSLNVATKSLSAYLKLIPGVSRLQRAISGANKSQTKFNKQIKTSTKLQNGFNFSIGKAIKNILAYGLGIRSIYVLFNKLRSAAVAGFGDMVKVFDPVNKSLSSISTSLLLMRNAVAAAVEPMLSVLAPALEKISALVADVAYKVASFIAALTGKSMVIKATRAQVDYAKSLDKTASSAKKAKNELAAFDDLDVLQKQDSGSGDEMPDPSEMFEEVPIDPLMADWAEKFKDFIERLKSPIMDAWDRVKDYVINGWKYMCQQLKALWADVARDFWKVWGEFKTEEMFRYIFLAIGDIMLIIGELAAKIREAWNYAENGYRILASIRDVGFEIAKHLHDITSYTRDWVQEQLNLKPLFTAIADVMETQVVPAVRRVLDLVVMIWNYGILELVRDFINNNLPVLVQAVGYFIEGFGLIAKHIQMALETGTKIDGALEYTRSRLDQILDKIEYFSHLISDTFAQMGEDFKNWAAELDFTPMFDAWISFLTNIQPLIEALFGKYEIIDGHMEHTDGLINKLWKETILPFWSYLIEDGGPKLIEILGQIFGEYDEETGMGIDWEHLTQQLSIFIETLEPFFELAWETLLIIIKDLGKAFDDFVNSNSLDWIIDHFKDWVENADPEELAHKIEKLFSTFIQVSVALHLINNILLPVITNFMTFHNFLNMTTMNKKIDTLNTSIDKLNGTTAATPSIFANFKAGFDPLIAKLTNFKDYLYLTNDTFLKVVEGFRAVGGVLSIVVGAFEVITGATNMMANGFSIAEEARVILGAGLIALGAILLGIPGMIAAVIAAVVAVAANLAAFGDDILDWAENKLPQLLSDGLKKVEEFGHNLGVKVGELIALVIVKLSELPGKIQTWISTVNWKEMGINILKGILGIFLSAVELIGFVIEAIGTFIASFIEGLEEGFDMHSPSKLMEPYGENILKGILEGIIQALTGIGEWVTTHIFTPMIEGVKTAFGIVGGVANSFKEIGGNIIEGLKKGISDAWDKGKKFVTDVFQKVTDTAHETYDENSPSKVFETIGGFLIEGMKNGIDNTMLTIDTSLRTVFESVIKPYFSAEMWSGLGTGIMEGLTLVFEQIGLLLETQLTMMWETYILPFFSPDKWNAELILPFMEMLTVAWQTLIDKFNQALTKLFTDVKVKWNTFSTWFNNTWTTFTTKWFTNLQTKWNKLMTWWNTSTTKWFTDLQQKWNKLITWWNNSTATWFNELQQKWNTVSSWFTLNWTLYINRWFIDLKLFWMKVRNWFDDSVKDWWENHVKPYFETGLWREQYMHIYDVAKEVFEMIREKISEEMNSAAESCMSACDAMAGSISNVIDMIDSLIEKLSQLEGMSGSVDVNFAGNAPHLAQGAVIPPNREFMAVLGDQREGTNIETPLNTMLEAFRSVMDEYSAPRASQNATMEVDGETFARLMLPYVMNEMHRQGYNTEIITEGM